MTQNILLINDMPSYGKVALAAMIPILSSMGHSLSSLPTALVSNTLNYGSIEILDSSDYMEKTLKLWETRNFPFDCLATGFILSDKQVDSILDFIQKRKEEGLFVMVDPIMGDNGKLYNGLGEEAVRRLRRLTAHADLVVPNVTEACFLSNRFLDKDSLSKEETKEVIRLLQKEGAKSVVITSVAGVDGKHYVCGYSHEEEEFFAFDYEKLPLQLPGTGDIFSSVLLGRHLQGYPLKSSVKKAMDTVYRFILENKDKQAEFPGIRIEKNLDFLKK